ncbi:MAG: hypothetical protein ABII74_09100 [Elusimicrobiota bacterium]
MKSFGKIVLVVVFCCLLAGIVFSAEPPVFIRGVRPLGMGGAFTALSSDQNAFFYNPAGLSRRTTSQITLLELPIGISRDAISFYQYYQDNKNALENFDQQTYDTQVRLTNEITDKVTKYRTHISLGLPNLNYLHCKEGFAWGIGVFDQFDARVKLNSGIILPTIDFSGYLDVLAGLPLAKKWATVPAIPYWKGKNLAVPGSVSLGTTIKYLKRAKIDERRKSILTFEEFDPILQWGQGYGLDLGMLYQPVKSWDIGLMISDFGGTKISYKEASNDTGTKAATTEVIAPQTNLGLAFSPRNLYYWPGRSLGLKEDRLVFVADLRDIFNADEKLLGENILAETFFKHLYFGGEFRWFLFDLRTGFNQGYPTFGAGLHLLFLHLDYAYYADELGRYTGQIPEWNHRITAALRF